MCRWIRCLVVLAILAPPTLAAARPGTLVRSFGQGGMVVAESGPGAGDMAWDVAVQSDGKIIAVGFDLVRYIPSGAVDTSFGTNGSVPIPVPQPAGRPLLAVLPGDAFQVALGTAGTCTVLRYASDGTLDPSFGTGGVVTTTLLPEVTEMVVQPDGKILLAGGDRLSVLRLEADGSIDVAFGTGGLASHPTVGDRTGGLGLQADGAIVVGADVSSPDGGDWVLTRYDATGQIDPSFGVGGLVTSDPLGGGIDVIRSIVVQPDGVVAVGQSDDGSQYWFVLVRYVNGVVDPIFGVLGVASINLHQPGGGNDLPRDALMDADGNLIVVGRADTDRQPFVVLRFEPNGTLDANFGTGGSALTFSTQAIDSYAGAAAPDGTIVVAGYASTTVGYADGFVVARYAGAGSELPRCPHTREFSCHDLPAGGTAALTMANGHDDADKKDGLSWQWRGAVAADFGDPTTTEGYALCVYKDDDEFWPPLRYAAPIPAAGLCRGKPCWKSTSGGFKHKSHDGSPGGVATLALKQANGETKIALKGRGAHLGGMHLLPIEPPFVVQLRNTSGRCWSSTFTDARVNDRVQLKAKASVP